MKWSTSTKPINLSDAIFVPMTVCHCHTHRCSCDRIGSHDKNNIRRKKKRNLSFADDERQRDSQRMKLEKTESFYRILSLIPRRHTQNNIKRQCQMALMTLNVLWRLMGPCWWKKQQRQQRHWRWHYIIKMKNFSNISSILCHLFIVKV